MSASPARWKDLCLDAVDQRLLGEFWASVLGLRVTPSTGPLPLDGEADHDRIWINAVDRPRAGKNRVHLDVHARAVADLEAMGARVLAPTEETGFGWTVMADPEGGEFCCFVRDELPQRRLAAVVVDCLDPVAQASWWAGVLGLTVDTTYAPHAYGVPHLTPDPDVRLVFVPVPEPRADPNRVHWDLYGAADALVDAGATPLWDTAGWRVLADPEGNEFCVFGAA